MERLKIKPAVYIAAKVNNQYLFLRRFNTGYCDGYFTFPSGHVDEGELPIEAAIREFKEEVDIDIKSSDLKLVHVLYEKDKYMDLYFLFETKDLKPKVNELNKSDLLLWVDAGNLNKIKFVPKVKIAFQNILKGQLFSQIEKGTETNDG